MKTNPKRSKQITDNTYSYSQWKDKGMRFTGYPDNLGLLVGQTNSNRYATGYAAKSADINGTPVVKVQNQGSSFSLGLRYLF